MLEHVNDAPRQSMIVATRLEDGTVLVTAADHARAAAKISPPAPEPAAGPAAAPENLTPEAPAESGTGEEIESDAS
ncbi:MAG: hypothetical protein WEA80_01860 [Gemmatimonadaceae bacterium]